MKREGAWVVSVISLIAGLVLIICHGTLDLITWIVVTIGILVVVPAVWLLLVNLFGAKERRNYIVAFAAAAALCLGLWICLSPATFEPVLVYVFAAVLMVMGICHCITIGVSHRIIDVPWWLYIIPVVMIVLGVIFIFVGSAFVTSVMVLIMGIALLLSSVSSVMEGVHRFDHRRELHPERYAPKQES